MEDDPNGRQPQLKTASIEDNLNEKQPQMLDTYSQNYSKNKRGVVDERERTFGKTF